MTDKKTPIHRVNVELSLEVDDEWVDYCVAYPDLFGSDYCGYWMQGIARSKDRQKGWLCWEFENDGRAQGFIDRMSDDEAKKLHGEAVRAWKAGEPLPPHYHVLNQEMALKMYAEGVKKYGLSQWDEGGADANMQDCALQLAMLGEVRYG